MKMMYVYSIKKVVSNGMTYIQGSWSIGSINGYTHVLVAICMHVHYLHGIYNYYIKLYMFNVISTRKCQYWPIPAQVLSPA